MIEPRRIPNLSQSLFGIDNELGATTASNKNKADTTKAQVRTSSELIRGYRLTIKNTTEKIKPKDFGEDFSVRVCMAESKKGYFKFYFTYYNEKEEG